MVASRTLQLLLAQVLFCLSQGSGELTSLLQPGPWRDAPALRATPGKPNVLFFIADDLTANVGHLGHPIAKTPNLDRLASQGASFRRMYANHPVCAPSRASFLTGILGGTSGNMFWSPWYENPVLNHSKNLMEYFQENGYQTIGTGKIFHHERATPKRPRDGWTEYGIAKDYGPVAYDGGAKKKVPHPKLPSPLRDSSEYGALDINFGRLSDVPFEGKGGGGWVYANGKPMRYNSTTDRDPTPDERNAEWAAKRIAELAQEARDGEGKPFFMAVGFVRPHTPIYVPDQYFDLYPIEDIPRPENEDDSQCFLRRLCDDPHGKYNRSMKGYRYYDDMNKAFPEHGVRKYTQAYLAGVSATDDNIGLVLDALDREEELRHRTLVMVVGDNGWSNGEKKWLFKHNPWEEGTRTVMVIRAPGFHGTDDSSVGKLVETPVSLIDVYPTLVDLCGLTGETKKSDAGAQLDGHSVRPLLDSDSWTGPDAAVSVIWAMEINKRSVSADLLGDSFSSTTLLEEAMHDGGSCKTNMRCHHWALRTRQHRYILYNDDSEELYDHENDPKEMVNHAASLDKKELKAQLKGTLLWRIGHPLVAADMLPSSN